MCRCADLQKREDRRQKTEKRKKKKDRRKKALTNKYINILIRYFMEESKSNIHTYLSTLSTFRIETLEDGVFGIAMTLLVLNLKIPDKIDKSVLNAVINIWPNLVTFFGSFVLLGVYWLGHRTAFHFIKHGDHVFHWFNIMLLMFVSIVPFSASLIAKYYYDQVAIIIYGINLIAIGTTMYLQWCYATYNFRLIDKELPTWIIRYAKIRTIFAPLAYLSAILISFISCRMSLVLYTIVPILYILPILLPVWKSIAEK